jgi:hypothetical protein
MIARVEKAGASGAIPPGTMLTAYRGQSAISPTTTVVRNADGSPGTSLAPVPWYMWLLLWLFLVTVAGAVLFQLARGVAHSAMALFRELEVASNRLEAVNGELRILVDRVGEAPAVFQSPTSLRQARYLERRRRGRARRRPHA